ncbi:hypothetical protein [Pseudovibrio sp. Tun.PSC04-5.I4]|uniref:hypothetical protein n=1 Tax=Pseudovibrio sp. Tun.PSC04-5.I4 TaxID=1798213 RepID=UPI00087EB497|nr:hypothetical protein [Pseudovibrio sp. Tun.PSC04-5.I4]SDQ17622.1 hypothetical protein SAMN04515695_0331 [Pseudovibrio sp. Tun.PSC04-5.I4]
MRQVFIFSVYVFLLTIVGTITGVLVGSFIYLAEYTQTLIFDGRFHADFYYQQNAALVMKNPWNRGFLWAFMFSVIVLIIRIKDGVWPHES